MQKLRKTFASAVMLMTILSMSLVTTVNVQAATAGDLVKVDGASAVYYLGADSKLYVFPNQDVFFSWYSDFNSVVTISATELNSYGAPKANVVMRAGSKLIKRPVPTAPEVYAVEPNGTLRWIDSEATAIALYGTAWATRVVDVADSFFTNYKADNAKTNKVTSAAYPAGSLIKSATDGTIYYIDTDGKARKIADEAAFNANRFKWSDVITVATGFTMPAMGADVASALFTDTSQGGGTGTGITPGAGTGLTVALASDTPAAKTVPSSATGVTFTKLNLTASNDGDVTIDTIKVKRTGVGQYNDLSGVFIYDGNVRLTNSRTLSSDTNIAEFNGMNYVIPKGTTKTLSIVANIGASKSGSHALGILDAASITTNGASVNGAFPVVGNTMALSSSASSGTLTIEKNGTLSNPVIGDMGASLAQFKLTAGNEDVYFNAITLKQDGDITTSLLSNYKLYQGTTELPITYTVNGRNVTLSLATPYKILNGGNKIFTVKGDVSANAEKSKTIIFYVYNAADIIATGATYGFGVSNTIDAYDATGDAQTLTLQGGGITVSNLTKPASDVKTDSTEVELMKVGVKAVSDRAEVQKMTLVLSTTKATTGGLDYGTYKDTNSNGDYDSGETLLIRNVKLKDADTGQILGSAKAITDADGWAATNDVDAQLTFTYNDYFAITKGTTRNIVVVADINSAQVSGVVYTAILNFSSNTVFMSKDSQDKEITDVVPKSTVTGTQRTTRTSSLTVSRASTPETRTVVKGSTVDALGMIFAAGTGTGNDVKVSGLTLDTYVDANVDGTFVLNSETGTTSNMLVQEVSLYVGNDKIAGPVAVDSNGKAIFTSSKFTNGFYTIAAGTSKTIIARATLTGTAPYGAEDDAFSFTLDAADITAEDAAGTVTPTVTNTDVNGTTAPSVSVRITGNGTIATAIDSSRPDAAIVLAGQAAEQELSRVRFTVTKEDFTVDKLTVQITNTPADRTSDDNIEYVKLYNTSGTAISEAVTLDSNGKATFSGLNILAKRTPETVVVVKAMFKAIGERSTNTNGTAGTDADSGDTVIATLSTTDSDFHAIGTYSGVVDNNADAAVGQTMIVRKTKPTLTLETLPSTSLGTAGTKTLMKFKVTADANGPIVLKGLEPDMQLNDAGGAALAITAGSVYLYDVTSDAVQLNGTGVNMDSLITIDAGKEVTISAGNSKIFEIRAAVTGNETTGESIETKIVKDAAHLDPAPYTETAANALADANNNFIWSDKSADTNAITSVEWINSYLLTSWPSAIAVLSK